MKLKRTLEEIAALATKEGIEGMSSVPARRFGLGENGISFVGESFVRYSQILNELYKSESLYQEFTFKDFESKIIQIVAPYVMAGTMIVKEADCDTLKKQLQEAPVCRFEIFRPIKGITLKSNDPYKIGPFTIYRVASHSKLITEDDPFGLLSKDPPEYLISISIKARHSERAQEFADLQFERFELILKFLIGTNNERFEVGILDYRGWRHQQTFLKMESGPLLFSAQNVGSFEPIPIDDPYFVSASAGYNRLWNLLEAESKSELERRIILAAEWIGQACKDRSPASAFLKSVIAMEILFTHQEKTLVNASILSQISESVALILGKDASNRMEIEKELKGLYSMRSAITHSGKSEVDYQNLQKSLGYARAVLSTLLSNAAFKDLKHVSDIYDLLKNAKYSCKSF